MSNAITNINQESSKDNIKIDISKIDSTAKSQIVNVLKDVENLLKDTTKDNPALSTIDDIIKRYPKPKQKPRFCFIYINKRRICIYYYQRFSWLYLVKS